MRHMKLALFATLLMLCMSLRVHPNVVSTINASVTGLIGFFVGMQEPGTSLACLSANFNIPSKVARIVTPDTNETIDHAWHATQTKASRAFPGNNSAIDGDDASSFFAPAIRITFAQITTLTLLPPPIRRQIAASPRNPQPLHLLE